MNKNLLKETLNVLERNGKTPADVEWVGSADGMLAISWKEFAEIAKDVEYDNGYGGAEVASDLVVVGKDWWLERGEYDGSEWWEFKKIPVRKFETDKFSKVVGGYNYNLADKNGEEED